MIWTGGEIIPPEELRIDVRDETFQHGLGLFETFRTWKGNPTLFPRHLERLRRSARSWNWRSNPTSCPTVGPSTIYRGTPNGRAGSVEDVRIRITMTGRRPAPSHTSDTRRSG